MQHGVRTLVNEHVKVYSTNKTDLASPRDSHALLGSDAVRRKWGVEPAQIADILALIGDSVDNIPGVPGVGPKTAADLLQGFGSVDVLYSRLGEVKSDKLRASLEGAREIVRRNQRLIRLRDELPSWSLEEMALRVPDTPRLRELFAQWGFKTLLAQSGHQPPQSPESPVQGALL